MGIGFAGPGGARNAGTTPANTSSTTSTTTVERLATPASTSVNNTVSQVLGKGDWLEYHVKVSGEGPSGPVSFEAYVEVTVIGVEGNHVRLRIKPPEGLTPEQCSLISKGAVTGNILFIALAVDDQDTITYGLHLRTPNRTCPTLIIPTGKEEKITISGTDMGHKYSATCTYTPKGVLSSLTFRDTYSANGKEANFEATITLVGSSKGLGEKIGNPPTGTPPTTTPIISGIAAAAAVTIVLTVTLRKR